MVDFAQALKERRASRRLSQLELALKAGTTQRHLSFIESGRSVPGREMVIRLTESLGLPLRERNEMLLRAGYAPAYPEQALDSTALAPVMDALGHILAGHLPYPAIIVDRSGDIVSANTAHSLLFEGCAGWLLVPPVNAYRAALHPEGMAPRIANFGEWARHVLHGLEAELARRHERPRPAGRLVRRADRVRPPGPARPRPPGLRRPAQAAHLPRRTAADHHDHELRHRGRRDRLRAQARGLPAGRRGYRCRPGRSCEASVMTPQERYEDLIDEFAGADGVTPPTGGSGFGRGALRYRRKIFAMFVRGQLVVKLPAPRVDELVAGGHGERFDANKGTPMKEWFSLDPGSGLPWLPLAREALSFAIAQGPP